MKKKLQEKDSLYNEKELFILDSMIEDKWGEDFWKQMFEKTHKSTKSIDGGVTYTIDIDDIYINKYIEEYHTNIEDFKETIQSFILKTINQIKEKNII